MKLTELKPCEFCGGSVTPFLHEVTVKRIFIKPDAVNRTLEELREGARLLQEMGQIIERDGVILGSLLGEEKAEKLRRDGEKHLR